MLKKLVTADDLITRKTSMSQEKFGKWIMSSKVGKEVVEELRANNVTKEELRSKGFVSAMLGLATLLK